MATVSTSVETASGGTHLAFRAQVFLATTLVILSSPLKSALKTKSSQSLRDGTPVPETLATSSPRMN